MPFHDIRRTTIWHFVRTRVQPLSRESLRNDFLFLFKSLKRSEILPAVRPTSATQPLSKECCSIPNSTSNIAICNRFVIDLPIVTKSCITWLSITEIFPWFKFSFPPIFLLMVMGGYALMKVGTNFFRSWKKRWFFCGVKTVVPSFTLKMRKSYKKLAFVYEYANA